MMTQALPHGRHLSGSPARLASVLRAWRHAREHRRMIRLPDRLLDDIGVGRQAIRERLPRSTWDLVACAWHPG